MSRALIEKRGWGLQIVATTTDPDRSHDFFGGASDLPVAKPWKPIHAGSRRRQQSPVRLAIRIGCMKTSHFRYQAQNFGRMSA